MQATNQRRPGISVISRKTPSCGPLSCQGRAQDGDMISCVTNAAPAMHSPCPDRSDEVLPMLDI